MFQFSMLTLLMKVLVVLCSSSSRKREYVIGCERAVSNQEKKEMGGGRREPGVSFKQ
jgi:hypothetical protein